MVMVVVVVEVVVNYQLGPKRCPFVTVIIKCNSVEAEDKYKDE